MGPHRMEVSLHGEGLLARADANLGSIGATYNLTMDPYEKYDMIFNGAAPTRLLRRRPGNIRARTMAGSCRSSNQ